MGLLIWYWLSTLLGSVGLGLEEEMEEGVVETLLYLERRASLPLRLG